MAALQQLSPVFPIGSSMNEAGNLEKATHLLPYVRQVMQKSQAGAKRP